MTPMQIRRLRLEEFSKLRLEQLEHGRRKRGDRTRCSRCERPIEECGGLSPGRPWGRQCESQRKLRQYHRTKSAAGTVAA